MWDESIPSADEQYQDPAAGAFADSDPAANVAWTDGQLMRLENEFRKAQRSFAYHPVISVRPLRGDPPYEYQVDYRLRTLATNEAGELQYIDEVSMHIWLPPGFPNQPPVVRPLAPVFHPNVAWEGIYLTRPWQPTDTLVTFAGRIGELLAYRSYDPESVVNSVAMEWLAQNSGSVPLDTRADFSPFNGGEPLGRIQRLGPSTLDQIRRALDDMRFALVAEEGAPTADEVVDFAKQTRSAISLFLDGDIPESLRQQASEFDDWCRELPESVSLWEYLRQQRTRAAAAETSVGHLKMAAGAFALALDALEKLVPGVPLAASPAAAVKAIPAMDKLAPQQLKLPPLARDFEKHSLECRRLIAAMKAVAPQPAVAPEGSLGRRLAAQSDTVREAVAAATRIAEQSLAEVDALSRRARPEIAALEQVVGWREYMDMFAKARLLEKQISEWGSAGVQAFFLENASGSFGPFQFEEPLDLGGARVVARSLQRGQIDVIDAVGQDVLGRGTSGSVEIVVGQSGPEAGHKSTFRLSERCDDLVVQIGFIQQQTVEALGRLQRAVAGATSWCGVISRLLAEPVQQQNLREAHRKATHRWKAIISDLAGLSRFKERLATYHLVARMNEEVPRIGELIGKAEARHKESTDKISQIMGKSSRDVETDRLIIPPKLAKSYADELGARDQAKHETARVQALLKQMAREVAVRISSPRLCGRPEVPAFRALPPVPDELASFADAMSDEAMKDSIATLGKRLGVEFKFAPPPAPVVAPAERPAAPGGAKEQRPPHLPRASVPTVSPAVGTAPGAKTPAAPAVDETVVENAGHVEPEETPGETAPAAEHNFDSGESEEQVDFSPHETSPAAMNFTADEEETQAEEEIIEGF